MGAFDSPTWPGLDRPLAHGVPMPTVTLRVARSRGAQRFSGSSLSTVAPEGAHPWAPVLPASRFGHRSTASSAMARRGTGFDSKRYLSEYSVAVVPDRSSNVRALDDPHE